MSLEHIYNHTFDPNAQDALGKIGRMIKPGATILELGPGTGYFTRHLKEVLYCTVDCVERSEEMALYAALYCREMWVADLDQIDLLSRFKEEAYDYIIAADVLEHLKDPQRIIRMCRTLLRPKGGLLLSIPNIGHAAVVGDLLKGNFEYRDEGILDRTHLRFFTRKSILDMLRASGFRVDNFSVTTLRPEHTEHKSQFNALPSSFQRQLLDRLDSLTYQFIVAASPGEMSDSEWQALLTDVSTQPFFQIVLFWASKGTGFTEEHSLSVRIPIGQRRQTLSFQLPEGALIDRLRFDPTDHPGFLRLFSICLKEKNRSSGKVENMIALDGPDKICRDIRLNNLYFCDAPGKGVFLATTNDPNLILELPRSIRPDEEQSWIFEVEMDWDWPISSDDLAFNLSLISEIRILTENLREKENKISELAAAMLAYKRDLAEREEQAKELAEKGERLAQKVLQLEGTVNAIYSSFGWSLIGACRRVREKLFPNNSGRRRVYTLVLNSIKILLNEGRRSFFEKAKNKIAKRFAKQDSTYTTWILNNEPDRTQLQKMQSAAKLWSYQPKISIVTPVYNPDEYALEECIKSVINQAYPHWEFCIVEGGSDRRYVKRIIKRFADKDPRIKVIWLPHNLGIVGNSNEALKLCTGEYVGFLDHDDMLAASALFEVAQLLNQDQNADLIYSDEDKVPPKNNKRYYPHFKPEFSQDMFLSYNYLCHFTVVRKKLVEEVGYFREGYEGSQDYDLFLRVTKKTSRVIRIPKVLYHWRATNESVASDSLAKPYAYASGKRAIEEYLQDRKVDADVVEGLFPGPYRVKYRIGRHQKISIIIPTKDKVSLLRQCISSILTKTDYSNFELLIVDNGSVESETFEFYDELKAERRIKVLHYDRPFNFSEINNYAVTQAKAESLVFLNNDTEVINSEWLTAMLEFGQRKDVGAVGAKLYYADDTIQHGGVIIGLGGVAGHSHKHYPRSSNGYMGRLNVIQNLSAVTAACMMVRKEIFTEVGGFDERLAVAFNDVDFCLKIRGRGYLIVFTPYAELYHYESKSRGYEDTPDRQARFQKEIEFMQCKWGHVLKRGDPYYNPNLTLNKEDFSLRL